MTLSHPAEILGPYKRHSLQASVSEGSAAQRSAPGGSPVISWTSPRQPRLTHSGTAVTRWLGHLGDAGEERGWTSGDVPTSCCIVSPRCEYERLTACRGSPSAYGRCRSYRPEARRQG